MFILSLRLIVTGALVRNVLTIHSTAVDMRQVSSILIATGIGALVVKLAGLMLRGTRRARVPSRTERYAERPDAPHPPMSARQSAPYRSIPGNRFGWPTPYSRHAPYRSMSDPSKPYGWNSSYKRLVQTQRRNNAQRQQEQVQRFHRDNAQRQQQQMQRFHRDNAQRQQQQMQHRHHRHS
jgi:hypothetical protein